MAPDCPAHPQKQKKKQQQQKQKIKQNSKKNHLNLYIFQFICTKNTGHSTLLQHKRKMAHVRPLAFFIFKNKRQVRLVSTKADPTIHHGGGGG